MLIILSWWTWQRNAINAVVRNRISRKTAKERKYFGDILGAYHMSSVSIATALDGDFIRFSEMLPRLPADAYLIRALQYAGKHSPFIGEIAVPRSMFAARVLEQGLDEMTRDLGGLVYDALIESGICVEATDESRAAALRRTVIGCGRECGAVTCLEACACSCTVSRDVSGTAQAVVPSSEGLGRGRGRGAEEEPPIPPDAVDEHERRGVLAACAAILGQRDISRELGSKVRVTEKALRAGAMSTSELSDFIGSVVYARTESRVAYLTARKPPKRQRQQVGSGSSGNKEVTA